MPVDVKIIVTDAPPLITLAAANCLDYLLFSGAAGDYSGRGVFRPRCDRARTPTEATAQRQR
jgi:hypothetical protein